MSRVYRDFGNVHVLLPCKAKRQYLLTCKVSRYCLLALQSSICLVMMPSLLLNAPENHCACQQDNCFKRSRSVISYYIRFTRGFQFLMWHMVRQRYRPWTIINPALVLGHCDWTEHACTWPMLSHCLRHWSSIEPELNKSKITPQKHILRNSYL